MDPTLNRPERSIARFDRSQLSGASIVVSSQAPGKLPRYLISDPLPIKTSDKDCKDCNEKRTHAVNGRIRN
jgi:hypothetical protein